MITATNFGAEDQKYHSQDQSSVENCTLISEILTSDTGSATPSHLSIADAPTATRSYPTPLRLISDQAHQLYTPDELPSEQSLSPTSNSSSPLLSGTQSFNHQSIRLLGHGNATGRAHEVEVLAEYERTRPRSNMRAAFMNMANSIIGAGIIGQPYAMRQAGLLAGIALLVTLTITVDWTIRLIVINSKLSGRRSFQGTVEYCFGRTGLVAISLAQWAFAFGGMVAFGIIVGDSIPHVAAAVWPGLGSIPILGLLTNRKAVILVFIMSISYPLSLYRDISKLAKTSTMALISMVIILITVISQGFLVPTESRDTPSASLLTFQSSILQAIGVISFGQSLLFHNWNACNIAYVSTAFVCHHNSLLIYDSLQAPTIDRFALVTHYSTFISLLACLLMALAGFLTFGSLTEGNVLNNFPPDNVMVNIARLCFGLNMLTTLPLEAFVCREVMATYWFPDKHFSMPFHLLSTTILIISAMTLSLLICDLGIVFELIGATSACMLAYILPPLCYIKLSTRSWKTIPAIVCVVFGFLVMVISLFQTMSKIYRQHGGTAKTC
ncbi:amino acid transporter [Blumeria hordei DH14]|uniref:Amino acid transporter n=1 Tax=Blumeria graminis f. sp. hordei (strain DH14) TaxID=546991 RepID=N1JDU1_BLUG1|nr:amino acid transporter [Blumeria hordei DH14]